MSVYPLLRNLRMQVPNFFFVARPPRFETFLFERAFPFWLKMLGPNGISKYRKVKQINYLT